MNKKSFDFTTEIVLLVIVLIAAVIIGLMLFGQGQTQPVQTIEEIQTQGVSDEVEAIEEDLEATEFTSLDLELQEIESELDAALSE